MKLNISQKGFYSQCSNSHNDHKQCQRIYGSREAIYNDYLIWPIALISFEQSNNIGKGLWRESESD